MRASFDPAATSWDVAVIGTGMGGATAGYELARRGHRVLFLEKGLDRHERDDGDERLRNGQWPQRLQASTSFGNSEFFAPLGCGVGGTTALYAAALERFSPADFAPRANFPQAPGSTLPERWPISYEELRPFYERAEELYRVRGTPDPLERGGEARLLAPPPLSPRDQHLHDSFRARGLHPYRVHVACEFVDGCTGCTAGPCARECKNDGARIGVLPAVKSLGARLLSQCEVLNLEADASKVTRLHCRWNGAELTLRARLVVLAAGAYMSPLLLLNSRSAAWPDGLANKSGLVGRNLMLHVSDYFAVAPLEALSGIGPQKSLALNDFYHHGGEKLGSFQTSGAAIDVGQIMQFIRESAERDPRGWRKLARAQPLWWRKLSSPAVRLAALAMYHLLNFRSAAVWASIIEDLPYHDNRVIPDQRAASGMRFEYRYPEELKTRVRSFRRRLVAALAPHRVITLSGENNLNYGHVCGTCRFGEDAATSVLDRDNRAHGLDNLYVVDASFFPSSGGTNPSLTIAANALRVAGLIHERLG